MDQLETLAPTDDNDSTTMDTTMDAATAADTATTEDTGETKDPARIDTHAGGNASSHPSNVWAGRESTTSMPQTAVSVSTSGTTTDNVSGNLWAVERDEDGFVTPTPISSSSRGATAKRTVRTAGSPRATVTPRATRAPAAIQAATGMPTPTGIQTPTGIRTPTAIQSHMRQSSTSTILSWKNSSGSLGTPSGGGHHDDGGNGSSSAGGVGDGGSGRRSSTGGFRGVPSRTGFGFNQNRYPPPPAAAPAPGGLPKHERPEDNPDHFDDTSSEYSVISTPQDERRNSPGHDRRKSLGMFSESFRGDLRRSPRGDRRYSPEFNRRRSMGMMSDHYRNDSRGSPRIGSRGLFSSLSTRESPTRSSGRTSPRWPGGTISRTNSPGSPSDRESSRILVDHNRIMVACRVRPRDDGGDNSKAQSVCVSVEDDTKTVAWAGDRGDEANARHFTFDYAAGENVGQEELFDRVRYADTSTVA